MTIERRQLIAMVLMVVLPLCVAGLSTLGLLQLGRILDNVSEEYAEARMLEPINRDLRIALLALDADAAVPPSAVRPALENAEAGLVEYLATQYDDVGSIQHQAVESGQASELLRQLRTVLGDEEAWRTSTGLSEEIQEVRSGLAALEAEADNAVQGSHELARNSRDSTLSLVFGATLLSTASCIALVIWSTRRVNLRLRELHLRLATRLPGTTAGTAGSVDGVVTQIEELNSRMLERIEESGRELLRRERLAGIGLLAADVAHEINNPMNAMLGLSELGLQSIERGPVDEVTRSELAESLRVIRREAFRCKGIVERLMAMVRSDRTSSWFDATRLVEETVQVARAARPDKAGCFATSGARVSTRAFGPAEDVRQILLTLLINAADAVGADGRIEVDATQTEREVWLRVRDNGRGFSEAVRQTFFTPFQSYSRSQGQEGHGGDKGEGKGAGLGLSIAHALAEGMGAALRPFSDGPGRGSMFILAIPVPEDST